MNQSSSQNDPLNFTAQVLQSELQIARQYSVRSQPTLMLFKNGTVEAQKIGTMSKSQLKAFIELNL